MRTSTLALPCSGQALTVEQRNDLLRLLPDNRDGYSFWMQEKTLSTQKRVNAVHGPITDSQLIDLYLSESQIIAMRFGRRTSFLIIDIDLDSPYHDAETVQKIREIFAKRRVDLHICQSSISGGLHLLALFDKPVKVKRLCDFAESLLKHHKFHIANGALEVYPSHSTKNKVIRLPFQKGFRLLDEELVPYWTGNEGSQARATMFLRIPRTTGRAVNFKTPTAQRATISIKAANQERLEVGEYYYQNGLNSKSTRSQALFAISYYLFVAKGLGYDRKEQRFQMMMDWMRTKHNGFSKEWLHSPRRVEEHIRRTAYWEPPNAQAAKPCRNNDFDEVNRRKGADIEWKIQNAVADLSQSKGLWKKNGKINRAAIERTVGVNKRTVTKYLPYIESLINDYEPQAG